MTKLIRYELIINVLYKRNLMSAVCFSFVLPIIIAIILSTKDYSPPKEIYFVAHIDFSAWACTYFCAAM